MAKLINVGKVMPLGEQKKSTVQKKTPKTEPSRTEGMIIIITTPLTNDSKSGCTHASLRTLHVTTKLLLYGEENTFVQSLISYSE